MRRSDLATRLGNIKNYEAVRVTFTGEGKQSYRLLYEQDEGDGWLERDVGNPHWTDACYYDLCDRICEQIKQHDYYDMILIGLVFRNGGNRVMKLLKKGGVI